MQGITPARNEIAEFKKEQNQIMMTATDRPAHERRLKPARATFLWKCGKSRKTGDARRQTKDVKRVCFVCQCPRKYESLQTPRLRISDRPLRLAMPQKKHDQRMN